MPSKPPMLSAKTSILSRLRPRKVSSPWKNSTSHPSATEARKIRKRSLIVKLLKESNQRKQNTPNRIKCTHLSIKGTFTSGTSLAGKKHKKKMSKVQRIASNLARLLFIVISEKTFHIALSNGLLIGCRIH